jgi:hypothetical protein
MSAGRFCSVCGEKLKPKPVVYSPFGSYCRRCAPEFDRARLIVFGIPIVFLVIGFAIGHYSKARDRFQFIGTPIESSMNASAMLPMVDARPSSPTVPARSVQPASPMIDGICGATTKSGRPCQRKVKGGGRCWQHRDK